MFTYERLYQVFGTPDFSRTSAKGETLQRELNRFVTMRWPEILYAAMDDNGEDHSDCTLYLSRCRELCRVKNDYQMYFSYKSSTRTLHVLSTIPDPENANELVLILAKHFLGVEVMATKRGWSDASPDDFAKARKAAESHKPMMTGFSEMASKFSSFEDARFRRAFKEIHDTKLTAERIEATLKNRRKLDEIKDARRKGEEACAELWEKYLRGELGNPVQNGKKRSYEDLFQKATAKAVLAKYRITTKKQIANALRNVKNRLKDA